MVAWELSETSLYRLRFNHGSSLGGMKRGERSRNPHAASGHRNSRLHFAEADIAQALLHLTVLRFVASWFIR